MRTELSVIGSVQRMFGGIEAGDIGKLDVACQALLSSAEASLILACNQASLQFHQGYNALNFGLHVFYALSVLGVTFQGKSISAILGPVTFEYASRATKVQLKNFGIDSSAGLMNLLDVVSNSQASQSADNSAIAQSKGLPQGPHNGLGWPSIFIALCEVETVLGDLQRQFPKASHQQINGFAVSLSQSWTQIRAAGQPPLAVEDVAGRSVAISHVRAAMKVLEMMDPNSGAGKSAKASHTPYDAAVALMKAGLIQKLFWQQTPDICDAMVVVWSVLLLGIHIKFFNSPFATVLKNWKNMFLTHLSHFVLFVFLPWIFWPMTGQDFLDVHPQSLISSDSPVSQIPEWWPQVCCLTCRMVNKKI